MTVGNVTLFNLQHWQAIQFIFPHFMRLTFSPAEQPEFCVIPRALAESIRRICSPCRNEMNIIRTIQLQRQRLGQINIRSNICSDF